MLNNLVTLLMLLRICFQKKICCQYIKFHTIRSSYVIIIFDEACLNLNYSQKESMSLLLRYDRMRIRSEEM